MNRPIRPVQEDELHGFVDGRLDPARHAEIADLLAQDPRLQQRVTDWQAQQAVLREAMAFMARAPVPPTLHLGRLMDARLARRHVPWRMAAGFLLCLMLGGAGGWMMRGKQAPSDMTWLTRQATSAHRVFAADENRPTELRLGRPYPAHPLALPASRPSCGRAGPHPARLSFHGWPPAGCGWRPGGDADVRR